MRESPMPASRCSDAVILIPGLMGSQLATPDGQVLWGLRPALLARQLIHGDVLKRLHLGPDDAIRPAGLVRFPGVIPGLGSLDPYTPLTRELRERILTHPAALCEFPYDWRQSIPVSAALLATAASAHLDAWRAHPHGNPDARLRLIGHSLGGLVARYFTDVLDGQAITHQTITLGTPHHGSLRALAALADGDILPSRPLGSNIRTLARTLPSLHELCPTYACVTTEDPLAPRRLRPDDLTALGVGSQQARDAARTQDALAHSTPGAGGVRALVGITQPTAQTATLRGGTLTLHEYIQHKNRAGDGTVYRDAAAPRGIQPDYLPQRHGRLASIPEAIAYIHAVLTEHQLGPPMAAESHIGIDTPPTVTAGRPFDVRIIAHPDRQVQCHATDTDTGRPSGAATFAARRDGQLSARLALPRPGLYTIHAKAGGASALTEHILCTPRPT